ncbi:hypothetical protein P7K49_034000, partial [Saguinus oedipus]
ANSRMYRQRELSTEKQERLTQAPRRHQAGLPWPQFTFPLESHPNSSKSSDSGIKG